MIKKDFVEKISIRTGIPSYIVKRVLSSFFIEFSEGLKRGERIELRNWGIFHIKVRKGRIGRNPRTGESVSIPPKKKVKFKPGKLLRF